MAGWSGGEVKDPARTVPRALLIGMTATTALYAALQFVCQGVLGPALATSKAAPPAEAAGVASADGQERAPRRAVVSMLGHAGAMILATPACCSRSHAMASPAALARLHPAHHTPVAAIVLQCVLALVLALPARSSVSPFSRTCRCSW